MTTRYSVDLEIIGLELTISDNSSASLEHVRTIAAQTISDILNSDGSIYNKGDLTITDIERAETEYEVTMTITLAVTSRQDEDEIRCILSDAVDSSRLCSSDTSFDVQDVDIDIKEA